MSSLTIGSLFSGIGGLELGLERAGLGPVVWQVEIDEFCRKVLAKHWPDAALYSDVKELKELPYVDLICGGFPCIDISNAGRREGIYGEHSSLWFEFARVIDMVRPRYVVVENVSALTHRGLGVVLGDLSARRYDAVWDCVPAAAVGAPHRRDRFYLVAWRVPDTDSDPVRDLAERREGTSQPPYGWNPFARYVGEARRAVAYSDGRGCEGVWLEEQDHRQVPRGDELDRPRGEATTVVEADGQVRLEWDLADPAGLLPREGLEPAGVDSSGHRSATRARQAQGEGERTLEESAVAHPHRKRRDRRTSSRGPSEEGGEAPERCSGELVDADGSGPQGQALGDVGEGCEVSSGGRPTFPPGPGDMHAWGRVPLDTQPAICRVAARVSPGLDDALKHRTQRLRALGNSVVPTVGEVVGHVVLEIERNRA